MQELLKERGVRASVEVSGRWTRVTVEVRDVPHAEREKLRPTVEMFALAVWSKYSKT